MQLSIRADELPTLLDRLPAGVRYLSLDCFDTLLWRNVVAPRDVFADLPFQGGGIWPRAKAEVRARHAAVFRRGKNEVTIEEIYRALKPGADEAAIAALVDAEIDAEARHCYGFAPTVALMRAAKARGLQVIIVSDTYLSSDQLGRLIARTAGDEVAALIDRIFVSSAHRLAKAQGLFKPVLRELKVRADAIFHVGDNLGADQTAPALLGIASAHLRQFHDDCAQRLRLEASAASMIDPRVRTSAPAYAPHRPLLSLYSSDDPAAAIGHDVLGPVMHSFVDWLEAERQAMADRIGRPVKLLFLMRDGHLPLEVYRAVHGDAHAAAVEISRFTARRASFVDEAAVRDFVMMEDMHGRPEVLANQLGLTRQEGLHLSRGKVGFAAQEEFARRATEPANLRKVVERAKSFADRLMAHLGQAGVQPGDAVMFADLGYAGTVQNLVEPVLRDRFGMTVAGRYLLLRDVVDLGLDKAGLIDIRHYDIPAVHTLTMPMAAIEQLSTIAQGSTVDYADDGTPVRKAADEKGRQNALRDRIQAACIDFASHGADGAVVRPAASDDADSRRSAAVGVLARFLFMPTAAEVAVLRDFQHDVNLGTDDMVALVDPDLAGAGLRQRGLFYLNQSDRLFVSGELQPHGMSNMLALFAASRHQFDLRATDFHSGKLELQAFVADATSQVPLTIEAHATHDGYYQATVPIGQGRFAVGLQLGAIAEFVQIEEAAFHTAEGLHDMLAALTSPAIPAQIVADGMTEESQGFYRCREQSLLLVPPPPANACGKDPLVLSLVFRPVVRRTARAALKAVA